MVSFLALLLSRLFPNLEAQFLEHRSLLIHTEKT